MSVIQDRPIRKRLAIVGIVLAAVTAFAGILGVALFTWWHTTLPDFELTVGVAASAEPSLAPTTDVDVIVAEYSAVTFIVQGDVGAARWLTGVSRALAFSVAPAGAAAVLVVLVRYLQDRRLSQAVSVSLAALGMWMGIAAVGGRLIYIEGVRQALSALGVATASDGSSDVAVLPSFWVDDLVRAGIVTMVVLLLAALLVRWGRSAHDELARVV